MTETIQSLQSAHRIGPDHVPVILGFGYEVDICAQHPACGVLIFRRQGQVQLVQARPVVRHQFGHGDGALFFFVGRRLQRKGLAE